MRRNRTVSHSVVSLLLAAIAGCTGSNNPDGRTLSFNSISTGPSSTTFSLLGRVTDGSTGAGVAGANLSIADGANDGKSTTSDFGGNYILIGLDASQFRLNASAPSYATQSKHVTLAANETISFQLAKCTFRLSTASTIDSPASGGAFPVVVTTEEGCEWTARSAASWIHVPATGAVSGSDTLMLTVDANSGPARKSTVTIAGESVAVVQSGQSS